jgi:hypothetical protein
MDAAVVLGVMSVCLYLVFRAVLFTQGGAADKLEASSGGVWQTAHYDRRGVTRVVVRKTSPGGQLLDEHVVGEIPIGEADYDQRFLAAMATARERQALFESEDG